MQTATFVAAATLAAALLATGAEAGRVRVSQEMDPGVRNFAVKGFVETIDQSAMTAAAVYDYNNPERCPSSFGGTAFLPQRNATVMAVIDTSQGQTLFTVHHFPVACFEGPTGSNETVTTSMSFELNFDDSTDCLVRDDPTVDQVVCTGAKATTTNTWLPDFTDGFVLGPLDGRWQLDAAYTAVEGVDQVIVRSASGGDIAGLSTDRVIRLDNTVEVRVDVQPGADLSCLNIDGNGVIPVAIFGSPDVDVAEIDIGLLELAGLQVRLRGGGQPQCATEDANGDGYLDLACKFYDDPDTWKPGAGMAAVSGELHDSTPIYGEDTICIRPPA